MILLTPKQFSTLRKWFLPERAGPLVGPHVLHTGQGSCHVDRRPEPRALLVESAGNYTLCGEPDVFTPAHLRQRIIGFVDAPEPFEALLRASFTKIVVWPRVILSRHGAPQQDAPRGFDIRPLDGRDAYQLWALTPESRWIASTWGGPAGLAASGYAWGGFADGRLVAVACTFYVGERYEDIGVITEAGFRGQGLSSACVAGLCGDIVMRGRQPCWSTTPDNTASLRVAEKSGFEIVRHDRLFVVGMDVPAPAHPAAN